ncbi:MAG: hypothetical protein AAF800_06410 [Planctomycetota bacterium]
MNFFTSVVVAGLTALLVAGCTLKNSSVGLVNQAPPAPVVGEVVPASANSTQHRELIRTVGFRGNRADPLGR